MSDNNKKLTPEEFEQLKQLQQLIMQKQQGAAGGQQAPKGMIGGLPHAANKWSFKHIFARILQSMQGGVKFIDQFIDLVVKKDGGKADDVVKAARSPILFGVFVVVFFVVFGSIWAMTAPLDSAAVAIGTVVSSSQKKAINHQEGGIIKAIYVKIGDHVKQGDKLIELDETATKSKYENVLHQYRSLLASETRLLAEINNEEKLNWPSFLLEDRAEKDVAKIIETQTNLFNSKTSLEAAERDSLRQRIKQYNKQIEGLNAKKVALQKTLEVIRDRLDATKKLNIKGFAQKSALLEFETKEASTQSEIAIADTEIAKSEQEITKTEIDLLNLDSKFSTQALQELKETQANLAANRENFFYLKEALGRIIVRSPVDGVVNQLNFHTIGSSIPQGQTIVEISPDADLLVIDAKVDPKNIDSIRVGLQCKIRFSAFKSRTTPLFIGKVVSLSPDLIIDHQRAQMDQLSNGYYLARVEIDMKNFEEIAKTRKLKLQPGMQAEVQIVTGTRTLMKYLLDPVYDAMFKGFKEK